jgi:alginate O-acetyltransferase complex protein AlgI
MSFTSQIFLIFCLLFYPAYFATKGTCYNNYVIVIASCIFYGWWDWRFVCLFGATTCFDFAAARLLFGDWYLAVLLPARLRSTRFNR